jgi:hypothetical protein
MREYLAKRLNKYISLMCIIAAQTKAAVYTKKYVECVKRVVVIPESELHSSTHPYHKTAPPRAIAIHENNCFLLSIESIQEDYLISSVSLYILCFSDNGAPLKDVSRDTSCRILFLENLVGDECYWDDTLNSHIGSLFD